MQGWETERGSPGLSIRCEVEHCLVPGWALGLEEVSPKAPHCPDVSEGLWGPVSLCHLTLAVTRYT